MHATHTDTRVFMFTQSCNEWSVTFQHPKNGDPLLWPQGAGSLIKSTQAGSVCVDSRLQAEISHSHTHTCSCHARSTMTQEIPP